MADIAPAQVSKSVGHRERRRKLRKSAEDLCLVTVEMGTAGFGLMLDVSEGGLGVQVMNRVEPGTDVEIAFKVPELTSRIEGTGVVTWCDGDGRLGIRFKQLKDNTNQLRQWVDSLPEAAVHEPIQFPPSPNATAISEQVRAIKSQIAASHLDVNLVLQFLVERVVELTHSNGGAIALGEGVEMVCRASSGLAPDVGVSIGTTSALTSECIRTGKIVRCDDTETDSRVDREICRELNLRSSLILPILFEAKVKGVLEVFSPLPKAFNENHLALLQQLAEFTAQIVYGPMPASAAQLESSAKAKAKPEHTALSALLTATTKAAEVPIPKPAETASVAKPAPQLVPSPPKPVEKSEKPSASATPATTSGAAAKPALVPEPVSAKPQAPAKEPVTAKAPAKEQEPAAKASKESVAAKEAVKELIPEVHFAADVVSEPASDEAGSESTDSHRALYIAAAVLLILVAAGWFYLTQRQPSSQPVAVTAPATQQPAQTLPATTATTSAPATTQPTAPAKPTQPGLVAADTVHTPNAAIVKADQSAPLVISSANQPRPRNDAPAAVAPSIAISSTPNLGSIALPGATARPELEKTQGAVSGGSLLKRVEPSYPLFARQQRIQGDVVVSARITKDGTLDRLKRLKGNPVFEPAAFAALKQWRYDPYKLNGQAQDVDTTITLQFKLKQ